MSSSSFHHNLFKTKFEAFFIKYAPEFTDEEELKLSYYERYKEFHDMFEEQVYNSIHVTFFFFLTFYICEIWIQLEIFCEKMEITQVEFMRRCRTASSDNRANHYIQILLSSVEFDTFLKLMKIMRPVAIARLKAG